MSIRVVARIRPLLKSELDKDTIVSASSSGTDESSKRPSIVKIPNPKNASEEFSFQFNRVYDQYTSQQDIFDDEGTNSSKISPTCSAVWADRDAIVAPTVKHLFNGFDVTLFAYGVTGTGKTHTMRGGKTLAERGVIPRLLSGIYRRSRKIEKESKGVTKVEVCMSYYEIYNDRVFDLFEAPEKRTASGLQLRDNGGKTVVVGLTERPCESLKEFERLYEQANVNRSTSATKVRYQLRSENGEKHAHEGSNSSMRIRRGLTPYFASTLPSPRATRRESVVHRPSTWRDLKTIGGQTMAKRDWSNRRASTGVCLYWRNASKPSARNKQGYPIENQG